MSEQQAPAPTDVVGGMPATRGSAGAATATIADPIGPLDGQALETFGRVADHLIPGAHGMPSAAEVVTADRLRFVIRSRPDLLVPLQAALRDELGADVRLRLDALASEAVNLAALQLAIVAGYYTDRRVRELIGYPGQMAIEVKSWLVPPYVEEGLIDAVLARGPVWRDPATGRRAIVPDAPRTYAERFIEKAPGPQGGRDGDPRA